MSLLYSALNAKWLVRGVLGACGGVRAQRLVVALALVVGLDFLPARRGPQALDLGQAQPSKHSPCSNSCENRLFGTYSCLSVTLYRVAHLVTDGMFDLDVLAWCVDVGAGRRTVACLRRARSSLLGVRKLHSLGLRACAIKNVKLLHPRFISRKSCKPGIICTHNRKESGKSLIYA